MPRPPPGAGAARRPPVGRRPRRARRGSPSTPAARRVLVTEDPASIGALTIVALAAEAQVLRKALTLRHPDLRNAFYDQVRARGQTPDSEKRLRRQVRKLKELRAADAEEIAQLKADVEALVGAQHQATVENSHLRQQLTDRHSVVRMLPA
ncbi:hypothetical protein SAMN05428944_0251 [Streptomyces sp. 1222.5]|nr:hypothetical protein BX260_7842 [Streptomyces sp. 5112.2]SEB55692.1 hypothetical protein SAMN05428944_0251 [Streptomyces sp. 1222.5]